MSDNTPPVPPQDPNQPYGGGATPPPPSYGGSPYGGGPQGTPPPNNLVFAILSTLFCCLPLGIASIVFATQVNTKWAAGDFAGAQEASDKAKKFAIYAVIGWVVFAVLYVLFIALVGFGTMSGSSTTTP